MILWPHGVSRGHKDPYSHVVLGCPSGTNSYPEDGPIPTEGCRVRGLDPPTHWGPWCGMVFPGKGVPSLLPRTSPCPDPHRSAGWAVVPLSSVLRGPGPPFSAPVAGHWECSGQGWRKGLSESPQSQSQHPANSQGCKPRRPQVGAGGGARSHIKSRIPTPSF